MSVYSESFVLTIKLAPIFLRIKLNIKILLELTPTCCERHLVLVEAVEHEDGDVEEHDGRVLAECWGPVLVVSCHIISRQNVLQSEHLEQDVTVTL